jgi:hypothetical protein
LSEWSLYLPKLQAVYFDFGWRCDWVVALVIADGTAHCAVIVVFYNAAFLLHFAFHLMKAQPKSN